MKILFLFLLINQVLALDYWKASNVSLVTEMRSHGNETYDCYVIGKSAKRWLSVQGSTESSVAEDCKYCEFGTFFVNSTKGNV